MDNYACSSLNICDELIHNHASNLILKKYLFLKHQAEPALFTVCKDLILKYSCKQQFKHLSSFALNRRKQISQRTKSCEKQRGVVDVTHEL